jgi:predicted amidophosphoribosyltransferase
VSDQDTAQQIKDPKFCSECGAEISAKAEICPKCGVRVAPVPGMTASGKRRITAALLV